MYRVNINCIVLSEECLYFKLKVAVLGYVPLNLSFGINLQFEWSYLVNCKFLNYLGNIMSPAVFTDVNISVHPGCFTNVF